MMGVTCKHPQLTEPYHIVDVNNTPDKALIGTRACGHDNIRSNREIRFSMANIGKHKTNCKKRMVHTL